MHDDNVSDTISQQCIMHKDKVRDTFPNNKSCTRTTYVIRLLTMSECIMQKDNISRVIPTIHFDKDNVCDTFPNNSNAKKT